MMLTRPRTAWFLAGLQLTLSILFYKELKNVLPPGFANASFMAYPTWFTVLNFLNFGLAAILALCALWKFEITAIVLLFAVHTVCPILFFTDLTRNPYFTQITLFNIWISFLWIAWLAESLQRKVFVFPRTALNLPLLVFFAVATLSWGASFMQHPARFHISMFWEGLRNWLFLIINCMAVFWISYNLDEKWRGRFLWVTFWVAGVAAAYGLMQFYGIERIWQKTLTPFANRPVSTFGNPNFLSSYLLLAVTPLIASILTARTAFQSWLSLGLLVTVITGLIATMTRSTWVGAFISVALLPLAPPVRQIIKSNLKKFYVFGAILLASVIFWPQSKLGGYRNPWERIIELKEIGTGKQYHPWSQRILIWSCSFGMVKDHLLLGKGWGLMELFYPYYQGGMLFHPVIGAFRTHANNSHNEVLEIWSQTGTLGMGVYAWLWVVMIVFALKMVKLVPSRGPPNPSAQVWSWALAAAAIGMLADNFFGNVSLHFCVPAFLFWWQAGLLFGMGKTASKNAEQESALDYHLIPAASHLKMILLWFGIIFFSASAVFAFRKEFQEIFYFNGFKISKAQGVPLTVAQDQLERAWKWFPREVNTNYELANTYARLSQEANRQGMAERAETYRKKSIWAYLESMKANAGYDEIYFNLAATLAISQWNEDDGPSFEVTRPDGKIEILSVPVMGGAITNFTRSLGINAMSLEGYNFLGNIYLQSRSKHLKEAGLLFDQGVRFYPKNKDLWVNMAFYNIELARYDEAMKCLAQAMTIDPFYEISRKNIRAVAVKTNGMSHPLVQVDLILSQMNGWIGAKNWPLLKEKIEYCVSVLPESAQLRLLLANVLFEMKRWDAAEVEYLKTLALDAQNVTAAYNLALTYALQGKTAQAQPALEKVLTMDPSHAEAKKTLESLPK